MFRPTILFLTAALGIAWSQSADDVAHETQRLKSLVDDEKRAISTDSSRNGKALSGCLICQYTMPVTLSA